MLSTAEQIVENLTAFPWGNFGVRPDVIKVMQHGNAVHVWIFSKSEKGIVREVAKTFWLNPGVRLGKLAELVSEFLGVTDRQTRGEVDLAFANGRMIQLGVGA